MSIEYFQNYNRKSFPILTTSAIYLIIGHSLFISWAFFPFISWAFFLFISWAFILNFEEID